MVWYENKYELDVNFKNIPTNVNHNHIHHFEEKESDFFDFLGKGALWAIGGLAIYGIAKCLSKKEETPPLSLPNINEIFDEVLYLFATAKKTYNQTKNKDKVSSIVRDIMEIVEFYKDKFSEEQRKKIKEEFRNIRNYM